MLCVVTGACKGAERLAGARCAVLCLWWPSCARRCRNPTLRPWLPPACPQVSGALNPDSGEGSKAFQECVLARHPRHGEYALAFITGRTVLQTHEGDMRLISVYVPTNHVYVGGLCAWWGCVAVVVRVCIVTLTPANLKSVQRRRRHLPAG